MSKFDKVYKRYDGFMEFFGLYKTGDILQMLSLDGDEIVADIGGGTGAIARALSSHCRQVHVIDESRGMLSIAKNHPNITTVLADAADTGFEDEHFDVVVMTDVIHHLPFQKEVVSEAFRILRRGGRLLILDFERKHFLVRLLFLFELLIFGRMKYKTSSEMEALMLKCGFDDIKTLKKGYYYIITGVKK